MQCARFDFVSLCECIIQRALEKTREAKETNATTFIAILLFYNRTIQLEKDSFNSSDFYSFLRQQLFTDQEIFDAAYNIQMNPSLQLENNDAQNANDTQNATNSRSELISYQPVQQTTSTTPIDFTEFLNLDDTLNTPQPTGSLDEWNGNHAKKHTMHTT